MSNNSHTENLIKVLGIIKYRGVLICPDGGKYFVFGKPYSTLQSAQWKIDSCDKILKKSIERGQRLREEAENNTED